jgi:type IV secretion system protein TrbI
VENQKSPKPPALVREMEAPTGIDLNPDPPRVAHVSKRAALVGFCIICGVATLLGVGIYRRSDQYRNVALAAEEKNVAPATAAASAITKDIPPGVVNLATDRDKAISQKFNNEQPLSPEESATMMNTGGRTVNPAAIRSYAQQEPTPEERRLADAYERELRAITAPTAIQSGSTGSIVQDAQNYTASTPNGAPASPLAALAQILAAKNGPSTPYGQSALSSPATDDQNMQSRKEAFLTKARAVNPDDYVKSTRTPSLSRYEIKAGWEIPAVMEQAVNSDLPGDLKALVTANVYDTATGRYLLIPQGARLIGSYNSSVAYGQDGLQVVWNRIIFPDASSIDLGGMVGQDAHGASGFRQDVDNHYKRLVGLSVLSSLFSAGFQLSQARSGTILQYPSPAEIAAGAVGQEVSQTGAQITRKNLNIQPTIKVPVGYKFNVRVNRDILFDLPYEATPVRTKQIKLPVVAETKNQR